ncbi:MAG: hypothetical protein IKR85_05690 [Clostridia bacterium]|nr:hypothetical protein [Clostridia bacterium]
MKNSFKKKLRQWLFEAILLTVFKTVLEFVFIPKYYAVFSYMSAELVFNSEKWIISTVVFGIFLLFLFNNKPVKQLMYLHIIRYLYLFCIIPTLTVYAFRATVGILDFVFPFLYFLIIVLLLKHYSYTALSDSNKLLKMPHLLHIDIVLPLLCGAIAVAIWALAGFPVVLNLSDTTEQRMALRAAKLPSIINYVFMFLGGTVFPYFAARYLDKKRYLLALLSLIFGLLLFFVNGMKTWLLLYVFIVVIYILHRFTAGSYLKFFYTFESFVILLMVLCVVLYNAFGEVAYLSQFSRIILVPSSIGYKSIGFFRENELLLLRESILRVFFQSPYPGGSDFYINYGRRITLTSSRANNGLWGDAYRNFGFLSLLFYPYAFSRIINIVISNSRDESERFVIFIMLFLVWQAINASFFTWLLTGGVIITILLLKIYRANKEVRSIAVTKAD